VPRRLPLSGLGPRCVYLRTFDDALAIRAHLRQGNHVAIIGGGFIGLELARPPASSAPKSPSSRRSRAS
jgi:3-phenylpropionate/trans-cinnamate dioxygenase ferredoxin reductase subunit